MFDYISLMYLIASFLCAATLLFLMYDGFWGASEASQFCLLKQNSEKELKKSMKESLQHFTVTLFGFLVLKHHFIYKWANLPECTTLDYIFCILFPVLNNGCLGLFILFKQCISETGAGFIMILMTALIVIIFSLFKGVRKARIENPRSGIIGKIFPIAFNKFRTCFLGFQDIWIGYGSAEERTFKPEPGPGSDRIQTEFRTSDPYSKPWISTRHFESNILKFLFRIDAPDSKFKKIQRFDRTAGFFQD